MFRLRGTVISRKISCCQATHMGSASFSATVNRYQIMSWAIDRKEQMLLGVRREGF